MDRALIHTPGLRVARAQRQVECPPDFLIEQDITRKTLDLIVQTDGKSYTTPSARQFLRMLRNHHRAYRQSRQDSQVRSEA